MAWLKPAAIAAAVLLAAPVVHAVVDGAAHAATCANPKQMNGFKTCANVEAAEKEGALTVYSPDPETNQAKLHAAFMEMFPKIKVTYIRLQTGALYAKLMAERQANVFQPDVLWLSDMTFVLDFQRRNGWANYESPELGAYRAEHKSSPEGQWAWTGLIIAGIAYNPTQVKPEDAPKSWADSLNPKWKGAINAKVSNSGLQHLTWSMLKQHVAADYWTKFGELQPRAFDSYVQQFDRTVSGQDQIIHTAQYSGYLQFKAKGAPIAFVNPTEGVTAAPYPAGVVDKAAELDRSSTSNSVPSPVGVLKCGILSTASSTLVSISTWLAVRLPHAGTFVVKSSSPAVRPMVVPVETGTFMSPIVLMTMAWVTTLSPLA